MKDMIAEGGIEILNTLENSCDIMLSLINNILDSSKIQANKLELTPQYVCINSIMIKVLGLFYEKSKSKCIELKYFIPNEMPTSIYIDEGRFIQILINLIGNAVKFTTKGYITVTLRFKMKGVEYKDEELVEVNMKKQFNRSEISINNNSSNSANDLTPTICKQQYSINEKVDRIEANDDTNKMLSFEVDDFPRTLSYIRNNKTPQVAKGKYSQKFFLNDDSPSEGKQGFLTISIEDTGIGINKENIAKLFKPFNQADRSIYKRFGGTGLGLWLSNELIKLMGGVIKVDSEEGKGSKFEIMVPVEAKDHISMKNADVGNVLDCLPNLPEPVLIIEDNFGRSMLIEKIFGFLGNSTKAVSNSSELRLALVNPNKYSMVYIEILSHKTNSFKIEALKILKECEQQFSMPLVLCTDYPERQVKSLIAKPQQTLCFPYKIQQLIRTLNQIRWSGGHKKQISTFAKQSAQPKLKISSNLDDHISSFCDIKDEMIILVVDDEPQIRRLYKRFIADLHNEVIKIVECNNGVEAIDKYNEFLDKVAVIVMDFNMPVMDGEEACSKIRKIESDHHKKTCFIVGISGDIAKPNSNFSAICIFMTSLEANREG